MGANFNIMEELELAKKEAEDCTKKATEFEYQVFKLKKEIDFQIEKKEEVL